MRRSAASSFWRTAVVATVLSGVAALGVVGVPSTALADGQGITSITISPSAAATSVGGNACQMYRVTELGANQQTVSLRVNLTPAAGIDSQFCDGVTSTNPEVGAGLLDHEDLQLDTTQSATFSFGVDAAKAAPGSIAISVYPSNGTNTPGAVKASATQLLAAGATQNALVTSLKAAPATLYATANKPGPAWTVTALHGSDTVSGVVNLTGTMTTSNGTPTGVEVTCSQATNDAGQSTCTAEAPAVGAYSITFTAPTGPAGQASTTVNLTTEPAAASGVTVSASCGTSSTLRSASDHCFIPSSAASIPVSAVVTVPPSGSGNPTPGAGLALSFVLATGQGVVDPTSCVTDAAGKCGTTLTITSPNHTEGEVVVGAVLSNGNTAEVHVDVDNTPQIPATNISVSAAHATQAVGSHDTITAKVTNQFGNPSSSGVLVSFTVTHGVLTGGGTTASAAIDAQGRASVSLSSATAGAAVVTATLPTGSGPPDCTAAADASTGAGAGNCTASTGVTFVKSLPKTVERPTLSVRSPSKGTIVLTARTHPSLKHAKVRFFRLSGGKHVTLTTVRTNGSGVATATAHLHPGATYTVDAEVIGLGSRYDSRRSASHKVHVKS